MTLTRSILLTLTHAMLTGCGQSLSLAPAPAASAAGYEAQRAASLSTKIKARFRGMFTRKDENKDNQWTAEDFAMPEDRFLNCFRRIDTDNDHVVTFKEYWPDDRHKELVETVESRAKVYMMNVEGKMTYDDAFELLDAYLKPYLDARSRKKESKAAFNDADANNDKTLNQAELAHALGIMESKAFERYIDRQVNRSKGQPEAFVETWRAQGF